MYMCVLELIYMFYNIYITINVGTKYSLYRTWSLLSEVYSLGRILLVVYLLPSKEAYAHHKAKL